MNPETVLHPAGFVETQECGIPYVRMQPSRESSGPILQEYMGDFNVPFRNSARLIKSLKLNWNKLSEEDRKNVIDFIGSDVFSEKEKNAQQSMKMQNLSMPLNNLDTQNLTEILDKIDNPDQEMKNMYTNEQLSAMKSELSLWSLKKHWYILLFAIVFILATIGLLVKPSKVF